MEDRETRASTPVYFGPLSNHQTVSFQPRKFTVSTAIVAKKFISKEKYGQALLWRTLKALYREHCKEGRLYGLDSGSVASKTPAISWQEQVNKKREFIEVILRRQTRLNLSKAARFSGCSFNTVKRVHQDMLYQGMYARYQYPNTKSQEDLSRFEESMAKLQGSYQTIADLRRENPGFSRKFISRRLRKAGFKWRMMPKKRKNPKKERPDSKKVIAVISHLVQALNSPSTTIIYIDEVHFPLFQTPDHRWTLGLQIDELIYNRRPVAEAKLSVVAACDLTGFIGIQVFEKEVTANDFLCLLQSVLERYPDDQRVTVLADNATWHTSPKVMDTQAGQFIHFNVPGLYRINAIENTFSWIRSEFRKRPLVNSLEEEARLLVDIFFSRENGRRFFGIHKNHLRQMLLLMKDNSQAVAFDDDSVMEEL